MNSYNYIWHRLWSPEAAEESIEESERHTSQSCQMYKCRHLLQKRLSKLQPPEEYSRKEQFVFIPRLALLSGESFFFFFFGKWCDFQAFSFRISNTDYSYSRCIQATFLLLLLSHPAQTQQLNMKGWVGGKNCSRLAKLCQTLVHKHRIVWDTNTDVLNLLTCPWEERRAHRKMGEHVVKDTHAPRLSNYSCNPLGCIVSWLLT